MRVHMSGELARIRVTLAAVLADVRTRTDIGVDLHGMLGFESFRDESGSGEISVGERRNRRRRKSGSGGSSHDLGHGVSRRRAVFRMLVVEHLRVREKPPTTVATVAFVTFVLLRVVLQLASEVEGLPAL
ncbi:hypothetical protein PFISCL1PPCAC_25328, partial [Pristionchus fissidentatus]